MEKEVKNMKKCIYCGAEISLGSVIDFCERCGVGVFGKKMFDTIVNNMEEARANGDLCHSNNAGKVVQDRFK
ncbi:MAG: hypothetical protein V1788_02575 [Nanoarchaeota archaeon]